MTPTIDVMERMKVIAERINRGQDSYAGRQDAWHKLGEVEGEFQTWKEMLAKAKADFTVFKDQLSYNGVKVPAFGTFRLDESANGDKSQGKFLGSVGEDYQVIQHTEGFELLDHLVNSIDGAHYETMGTLDYGRVVWGQVDPNLTITVGDDVQSVLLSFHTSHDGTKAFDVYESMLRHVCRNTLRAGSLKRLANSLRVKHTKNSAKKIEGLKTEIDEIKNVAMTMQERLNFLAGKKVTRESLDSIMKRLFPMTVDEKGEEKSSTRRDNVLGEILKTYEYNDDNMFPEQRGSAYNLLNAITDYADHQRETRGNQRAESAVFGSGDKLKSQAFEMIMVGAKDMPEMRYQTISGGSRGSGRGSVSLEGSGLLGM